MNQESTGERPETVWYKLRRTPQWQTYVEGAAKAWLEEISCTLSGEETPDGSRTGLSGVLRDPDLIAAVDRLGRLAGEVTLEELRLSAGRPGDSSEARVLCEDLIFLHAVADEACSGFGLPNAPLGNVLWRITSRTSCSRLGAPSRPSRSTTGLSYPRCARRGRGSRCARFRTT